MIPGQMIPENDESLPGTERLSADDEQVEGDRRGKILAGGMDAGTGDLRRRAFPLPAAAFRQLLEQYRAGAPMLPRSTSRPQRHSCSGIGTRSAPWTTAARARSARVGGAPLEPRPPACDGPAERIAQARPLIARKRPRAPRWARHGARLARILARAAVTSRRGCLNADRPRFTRNVGEPGPGLHHLGLPLDATPSGAAPGKKSQVGSELPYGIIIAQLPFAASSVSSVERFVSIFFFYESCAGEDQRQTRFPDFPDPSVLPCPPAEVPPRLLPRSSWK